MTHLANMPLVPTRTGEAPVLAAQRRRWIFRDMHRTLFCLILLAAQATAADFRVLDFGQSCSNVEELEVAIGSEPIQWNPRKPGLRAFKARVFDREVSVLYFCPEGMLFGGHYFFPDEGLTDAQRSFRATYDSLLSTYSDAFLDNTPWQPNADPRFVEADPRKYRATWRDAKVSTSISLMPSKVEGTELWHVFVMVTRYKR